MKTTLKKIRAHHPCEEGWTKLLAAKGKTKADDEVLSIIDVLESNGIDDALWCLRSVDGHEKEKRLYAVWCARQVKHLLKDQRSLDALDVAESYANGNATRAELDAAWDAAWDAAKDADSAAARDAASAAAWDAARAAASAATRDAARAAASAAASAATRDAARDAAWDVQAAKLRELCLQIDDANGEG